MRFLDCKSFPTRHFRTRKRKRWKKGANLDYFVAETRNNFSLGNPSFKLTPGSKNIPKARFCLRRSKSGLPKPISRLFFEIASSGQILSQIWYQIWSQIVSQIWPRDRNLLKGKILSLSRDFLTFRIVLTPCFLV